MHTTVFHHVLTRTRRGSRRHSRVAPSPLPSSHFRQLVGVLFPHRCLACRGGRRPVRVISHLPRTYCKQPKPEGYYENTIALVGTATFHLYQTNDNLVDPKDR